MPVQLTQSTGDSHMDAYIVAIISLYEAAFPERIRGCYLVGSYGDDTHIPGSDIDMEIVFKDALTIDEIGRSAVIKDACRILAPIHLDLPVKAEATLAQSDTVALKLASKFVYGQDTRETMPLPTMEVYLQQISRPTQRGLTARFRQERVRLPLDYPADDEFYGYIPALFEDSTTPIKLWVLNVGWLATFLLAYKARVYVPSKRHMIRLYREHIHDEWTEFITEVYEIGRNQWHYQVPQSEADNARFKALCQQTLAFENYVASVYVNYLKDGLQRFDAWDAQKRLVALGGAE